MILTVVEPRMMIIILLLFISSRSSIKLYDKVNIKHNPWFFIILFNLNVESSDCKQVIWVIWLNFDFLQGADLNSV
jgi:hypothetical protein